MGQLQRLAQLVLHPRQGTEVVARNRAIDRRRHGVVDRCHVRRGAHAEVAGPLRDALSQLQLAYAQLAGLFACVAGGVLDLVPVWWGFAIMVAVAPAAMLDMIVVHELAHLKEREHNKPFYALCDHMLPGYHQIEFDTRLYLTWRAQDAAPG